MWSNCRCEKGGHRDELVAEPGAAQALRNELLAAKSNKAQHWRGIEIQPLFEPGGGKMFGVMRATRNGKAYWRYAFSGQVGKAWEIDGWVPPIFDAKAWKALERRHDPKIQALTARINRGENPRELGQQRKALSNSLLDAYLELYWVRAFNGASAPIAALYPTPRPPTGAGDCCAPKLLDAAIREGLQVQSLTEVFLGAAPMSKARQCGEISAPCLPKCAPLLDYILCPNAQDHSEVQG